MKKEPPIERLRGGAKPSLTNAQVWAIRKRVREGEELQTLANEYGVSKRTISKAIYGQGAYEGV